MEQRRQTALRLARQSQESTATARSLQAAIMAGRKGHVHPMMPSSSPAPRVRRCRAPARLAHVRRPRAPTGLAPLRASGGAGLAHVRRRRAPTSFAHTAVAALPADLAPLCTSRHRPRAPGLPWVRRLPRTARRLDACPLGSAPPPLPPPPLCSKGWEDSGVCGGGVGGGSRDSTLSLQGYFGQSPDNLDRF